MSGVINFKFESGVERALDRLGEQLGERALRAAAFSGADIIRDEVVVQAPELTGLLKKNIIIKRLEENSDDNRRQVYLITVRSGRAKQIKQGKRGKKVALPAQKPTAAYYWRFVEFGTSKVRPNPFMRRALDSTRADAQTAIKDTLRAKLRELKAAP